MSQLIQRNDSFAISCDRGEFDVLSVQCEGAHFVIGTVYDDAVTFEGKQGSVSQLHASGFSW